MNNDNWRSFYTKKLLLKPFGNISWISLAAGFTIGALTDIYPRASFAVFGVLTLIFAGIKTWQIIGSRRRSELAGWDEFLRDPNKYAVDIVAQSNEHFLVVGQAIETLPHPALNTRADISDVGWDSEELILNDLQEEFDSKSLLKSVGGFKEFDPPNGRKYCLVDTSFITLDSPALAFDLRYTNYFTLKSVLPALAQNSQLRAEYASLQPSLNHIPHSLCLHYILRFSDGEILCMRRHPKAAYHANLWSFSGEEQLSDLDFELPNPAQSFFQRTFCEEVLALRDQSPSTLAERWVTASTIVKSMRLWSIFVEEQIFNFSLLGFYQLSVDKEEFASLHNNLVNRGIGARDKEGDFFIASPSMVKNLLFTGKCVVQGLFTNEAQTLEVQSLHPTSRYRVFRLLRALNRKPLEPGQK